MSIIKNFKEFNTINESVISDQTGTKSSIIGDPKLTNLLDAKDIKWIMSPNVKIGKEGRFFIFTDGKREMVASYGDGDFKIMKTLGKITKKTKEFHDSINESIYGADVADPMVEKDWDDLYELAKEEPLKSKIKGMLVKIFKDKEVMVKVADNFEWSDGSNGIINFSNLNHYITDIGYKCYADEPSNIEDIEDMKHCILYAYASPEGENRRGEKHRNFKYNPNDEFSW